MSKVVDKELDEIYTAIDSLMRAGCWNFLHEHFKALEQQTWRLDVDVLLTYATVSLPGKKKIPSRERFIKSCKMRHPDVDWKGLD